MNQRYNEIIPAILFSFLIPIFYVVLTFMDPIVPLPQFKNATDVEYLIQAGHEYSLFYAVLIFTCISGTIDLLEKNRTKLIRILYYSLNFILTFSIWRTLMIYNEIIRLESSSILGEINTYISNWHSSLFVTLLINPVFRIIIVSSMFFFFTILFEKYQDNNHN
jgi:nitrogen fixation/metabolism regulation signal transduction histidine kinase